MEAEQIYEVLSTAHELGLIEINHQQVLEDALVDSEFLMAFDHKQNDSVLRAVALLVELDNKDPKRVGAKLARRYPDYKVHEIGCVERYVSSSGNDTWKAFDQDGEIIYLRQKDKALLQKAGLWDVLNTMPVGAEWDAEIVVHTTQDGNFRKVQMIEEGGTIETPPPDPLPVDGEGERVQFAPTPEEAAEAMRELAKSVQAAYEPHPLDCQCPECTGIVPVQEKTAESLRELPSNQLNAIMWARDLIEAGNFVIVDFETTDLNGYPVEATAVSPNGELVFASRIKPPDGEKINPKAFAVHGISLDDLKDCPEWGAVASDFADVIKGKQVVIYNAEFDLKIIHRANHHYGIPLQVSAVCAMRQYAEYNGDWDNYHHDYRFVKLVDAARQMGVDVIGAHSAVGDALMTLAVIKALAKLPQGILISKSPIDMVSSEK